MDFSVFAFVIISSDKNLLFYIPTSQVQVLNTTTTLQTYGRQGLHYLSSYFPSCFLYKNFQNQMKGNANEEQFIYSSSCSIFGWKLTAALQPGKLKKVSGPCLCGIWLRTDNSLTACLGCENKKIAQKSIQPFLYSLGYNGNWTVFKQHSKLTLK